MGFRSGAIYRARTLLEHAGGHGMLEAEADVPDLAGTRIRC